MRGWAVSGAAVAALLALSTSACTEPPAGQKASGVGSSGTTSASTTSAPAGMAATQSPPSLTSSAPATTMTTSQTSPTQTPLSAQARCAAGVASRLSAKAKAGQLIWVGWPNGTSASAIGATAKTWGLGGVFLLGGWSGAGHIADQVAALQAKSGTGVTGRLFVAADQEGGAVQQARGTGFSAIPSARAQDAMTPGQLRAASAQWARQLKAAGINVNLAPVADTVPASLGASNAPIGKYGREYSSDPHENARMVPGFVQGMHDGGVAATVKHFPGLGRIRGNTDTTSQGTTDTQTTTTDRYLEPFAAGIDAGTDLVMVGTAIYTRIDPGNRAAFSPAVITSLLREQMGYAGVVVSDDLGAAASVQSIPAGQRATRFVAAGGDIILVAQPALADDMHRALVAKAKASPTFSAQVDTAVVRVLTLKAERGLLTCPG